MVITEELIEECKRRYPIGTQCISAYSGKTSEIANHNVTLNGSKLGVMFDTTNGAGSRCYVIYNDKWAEIISTPEITINSFEIW